MGTVTCAVILKSIMSISDISLVFLNYSLDIGLHTCLFKGRQQAICAERCALQYHGSYGIRKIRKNSGKTLENRLILHKSGKHQEISMNTKTPLYINLIFYVCISNYIYIF